MIKDKKKHFKDISTPLFIIGSVLLVVFVLGSFLYYFLSLANNNNNSSSLEELVGSLAAGPKVPYGDPLISNARLTYPKVLADDPHLGDNSASVTIFIFSDFTCQACAQQEIILNNMLSQYQSREVRIVWKGVATTAKGLLAQQAAYCAQAQGEFWEMADNLFANQEKLNRQFYSQTALDLELNVDEFDDCLDTAARQDKIYDNNVDATDLGIHSLPYFFIDNTPYEGVLSELELKAIITLLINK